MRSLPEVTLQPDNSLPEYFDIELNEFAEFYPMWLQRRATDRKFMPVRGGLRDQPQREMAVLLYIDMLFDKMLAQNDEQITKLAEAEAKRK